MQKEITLVNGKGYKLPAVIHMPETRNGIGLVLIHGHTGDKDEEVFIYLGNELEKIGITVLRMDMTGNGKAEGKFYEGDMTQEIEDVKIAVRGLKENGCKKIYLLGHSLGANVIAFFALEKKVDGLIFLAPAREPEDIELMMFTEEELDLARNGGVIEKHYEFYDAYDKNKRFYYNSDYFKDLAKNNFRKALRQLKVKKLFIHGDKDYVVPIEHTYQSYRISLQPKKIIVVEGTDHLFLPDEYKEKVLEVVRDFLI